MGLLHILLGLLLTAVANTEDYCSSCGCIYQDFTEIEKDDYVFTEIRTDEYRDFIYRMYDTLRYNYLAYNYIFSYYRMTEPPPELPETSVCSSEQKHLLGYFKNYGLTLCLVVKPYLQRVKKAECCGEQPPCGKNTRCVPGGYARRRYLVYCDAIYRDPYGCLIGTDVLSATTPKDIDTSEFIGSIPNRRKREDDENIDNSTASNDRAKRYEKCPPNFGYFAFRDDFLPSTCTARDCNCG